MKEVKAVGTGPASGSAHPCSSSLRAGRRPTRVTRSHRLIFHALIFLLLFTFGCANIYTARGIYHRVQPGETLTLLAERYHTSLQELAELNNIRDPARVKVGRSIFIPRVKVERFTRFRLTKKGRRPPRKTVVSGKKIQVEQGRFSWPVQGPLSSIYGVRRGRRHDGIDIRADRGTSIWAADDGEVVYSKRLRGYGNLVLLKHEGDFFTVYAHNSVNLVKKGGRVKRGELIAKVGSTGRATGPHLHFEVREGSRPRNPLFFLPESRYVKRALEAEEKGEAATGGE